jgi:hypothetical protein
MGGRWLYFVSYDGWLSTDVRNASRIGTFRGADPIRIELNYEDGSSFLWTGPWKPKQLWRRLWNEYQDWRQDR